MQNKAVWAFLLCLLLSANATYAQRFPGFQAWTSGSSIRNSDLLFENTLGLDSVPTPVSRRAPVYPLEEKLSGFTGSATIGFSIDRDGPVTNLVVNASSSEPPRGNPSVSQSRLEGAAQQFAGAATIAMSSWEYEPAVVDGKPTEVRAQMTWRYFVRSAGRSTNIRVFGGELILIDD